MTDGGVGNTLAGPVLDPLYVTVNVGTFGVNEVEKAGTRMNELDEAGSTRTVLTIVLVLGRVTTVVDSAMEVLWNVST